MEVTKRQNSHYLLVYYNVRVFCDSLIYRSVEETCNICILGYCDQLLSTLYVNWSNEVKPHLYFPIDIIEKHPYLIYHIILLD